jgi:molecular chaperone GrpE
MSDQRSDGGLRRHRTRAQERIDALDEELRASVAQESPAGDAAPADEIVRLRAELETARRETDEMKAAWQRSAADFANFRRRSEQEREQNAGLANDALLRKLLVVADDFDRALAALPAELSTETWVEGVVAIDRKLRALLDSEGVTPIEALGHPFDPREHEAIRHEETTQVPDGTVTGEFQRGYRVRDRVLRPSLVSVANNHAGGLGPDAIRGGIN